MRRDRRLWYRWGVWALGIGLSVWAVCGPGFSLVSDTRLASTPFHGDEAFGLAQTYYFDLYVLEGDWHDARWFEGFLATDQPHVGHYLAGWGLYRAGLDRPSNELYDFRLSQEENRAEGRVPTDEALLAARGVMAALGCATIALVALMGLAAGRPLTGALAAWLLGANKLFVEAVTRAMHDAPLLAFSSAAVVLFMVVFRLLGGGVAGRKVAGLTVMVPAGLCCGLAIGSKLNGLLCLGFGVMVAFLVLAQGGLRTWYRRVWLCAGVYALVVASALGTFYWTNPYLCSYPSDQTWRHIGLVEGLRSLFTARASASGGQRAIYPQDAIDSGIVARARMVGARAFGLPTAPGPNHKTHATLAGVTGARVDGWLFLGGLSLLSVSAVRTYRLRREVSPSLLLALWALTGAAAVTFWIPLDWDRYYLPIIVPAQLVIAAVPAALLEWWVVEPAKAKTLEATQAD